jgi:uncharacterized membrane protein YdfJ with MMPL/SSD domain
VLAAAIITTAIAATYGTAVFSHLNTGGFYSTNFDSYRAEQQIADHFGGSTGSLIVLFHSASGLTVDSPTFEAAVNQTLQVAKADHGVSSVSDYYTTHAPAMLSSDHTSTFAVVQIAGNDAQVLATTTELRPKLSSSLLTVETGGDPGVNEDFNNQIASDLKKAETISFIALAVLLIIVFRGLVAALLPLLLGAFGVLGAFLVVRLLTEVTTISQYAINVIILLGLGLSIDYSLFVVSRFREELRRHQVQQAITITMQTAGRTVFFSGLTVILSLLGLMVFPINFLRSMGIGASCAVAVAMIGALTLLPALMSKLGNRVNALSFGTTRGDYLAIKRGETVSDHQRSRIWYRVAKFAMRRPVVTIALIVIPLAFMGQYFRLASFSSADYRSLPAGTQSRLVAEALNNDFPGGGANPIQIIVHTAGPVLQASTLQDLKNYQSSISHLAGVTAVTSVLTLNPALPLADYSTSFNSAETPAVTRAAVANFVSGQYTVLDVTYKSSYDMPLAKNLVTEIRAQSRPSNWTVLVGGMSADLVDLLASLGHYAVYAAVIVVVALFLLLLVMLGSVVVPIQALVANILSLSATFGILIWVFQEGHLSKLLGFTSVGSIDATQPVLIFGIAFGLSMDYSVFLLSRIKEHYDQNGDPGESIALGLQKTGPIITSAAILFIVVVSAFATSAIPLIKQIGLGLALAVFIDAFFVRMLLVPAMMYLFGHATWWAPAWIKAISKRTESAHDA